MGREGRRVERETHDQPMTRVHTHMCTHMCMCMCMTCTCTCTCTHAHVHTMCNNMCMCMCGAGTRRTRIACLRTRGASRPDLDGCANTRLHYAVLLRRPPFAATATVALRRGAGEDGVPLTLEHARCRVKGQADTSSGGAAPRRRAQ